MYKFCHQSSINGVILVFLLLTLNKFLNLLIVSMFFVDFCGVGILLEKDGKKDSGLSFSFYNRTFTKTDLSFLWKFEACKGTKTYMESTFLVFLKKSENDGSSKFQKVSLLSD